MNERKYKIIAELELIIVLKKIVKSKGDVQVHCSGSKFFRILRFEDIFAGTY